ncbi:hypothetical protein E7Z54_20625 [Nocardioides sp.]|nr:hypothetical protein E7Z54_20625 [Nocardioides sp.]
MGRRRHPHFRRAAQAGAPFDWVFASRVIEHVPDLVGWLEQTESLVVEDGALVLVVPDRRPPGQEPDADAIPARLTDLRDQRDETANLRAGVRQQRTAIKDQRARLRERRKLAAIRSSLRWRVAARLAAAGPGASSSAVAPQRDRWASRWRSSSPSSITGVASTAFPMASPSHGA